MTRNRNTALAISVAAVLCAIAVIALCVPSAAPAVNRWDIIGPHYAWLLHTARCESGAGGPPDWRAVSPSGRYRGGLQFSRSTWRSVGGRGDPAGASRTEQLYRGALLLRRAGAGQWPVCGRHRHG